MPYTVKDYLREVTLDNLDTLTPEERLKGIALKERLKGIPVKDRFHGVSLEEALKYFFLDESEEKKRNILQKLLKEEQKK